MARDNEHMPRLDGMWSRWHRVGAGCLLAVVVVVVWQVGVRVPAARGDVPVPSGTPGGYSVGGIDVSAYEGVIDWPAVAGTGVRFAYIRASEQANIPDATFGTNSANAKAQGLLVGAYHRARPDVRGGEAQADYFLGRAGFTNDGRTLPPVVDMEWPRAGWTSQSGGPLNSCYNMTASQLVAWTRAFLSEVSARTGRLGIVYTSTSWWNLCTHSDPTFGANPLWVARYSASPLPLPAGWSGFTFWQYSSTGRMPNGGEVDQDVFRGDAAALGWLARGTPVALTSWVDHAYQHVVYASADGHIRELYFRLGGSRWKSNDLTVAAGAPPAVVGSALTSWVDRRHQHVVYAAADGHVRELYSPLGAGRWRQSDLTAAASAPAAAPGSDLSSWVDHRYQHIVYATTDGHVRELHFRLAGGRWKQTDLIVAASAPPALPANALSSWVAGASQHVAYLTADGHVRELSLPLDGGRWKHTDLTAGTRAAPAAPGSALTSWADHKHQHVAYVGADGRARELYARVADTAWKQNDLTTSAGAASAIPGSALASWVDRNYQHLFYLSAERHARELYAPRAGGRWKQSDLTGSAGGPPGVPGSALSSWVDRKYQHVVYVASDGHARELYRPRAGGRWNQTDLTASAGAPPAMLGAAITS